MSTDSKERKVKGWESIAEPWDCCVRDVHRGFSELQGGSPNLDSAELVGWNFMAVGV